MRVVTMFATHKNNLIDSEGRDCFNLNTFDFSKASWRRHLVETFPNHSEEVSKVIGKIERMYYDEETISNRKHFKINDVYIWMNISVIW